MLVADAHDFCITCAFSCMPLSHVHSHSSYANLLHRLVSPEGTFTLQARSDGERQAWVDTIHGVINCLLNTVSTSASPPNADPLPLPTTHRPSYTGGGTGGGQPSSGGAGGGGGSSADGGGGSSASGGTSSVRRNSGGHPHTSVSQSSGGHRRAASRSALPDVDTATLLMNSVAANVAGA